MVLNKGAHQASKRRRQLSKLGGWGRPGTNRITKRLQRRGQTITSWARENGFSRSTVFSLLHTAGYKGTVGVGKQIIDALLRDGFVTKREYGLVPFRKKEV